MSDNFDGNVITISGYGGISGLSTGSSGQLLTVGCTGSSSWNNISIAPSSSYYSIGGSNGINNNWSSALSASSASIAKVEVNENGITMNEGTDIKLGNISLIDSLQRIESRLAILKPDKDLEKDWEELKRLGDAYRELEKEIKEKIITWDILKKED